MKNKADVLIAGGGLAGLCLAKQLKSRHPDLDVLVLEKNRFPVPQAIAKVGESTVEIGARYLTQTIGLDSHIKDSHLRKFGLRCFFGQENTIDTQDELGPSQSFSVPTYQLDRGDLENHLFDKVTKLGVRIEQGVTTESVEIDKSDARQHTLHADTHTGKQKFSGRWLLDASGRRGLLKSQLNLHKPSPHKGNAVWFRVNTRIEIDDWSSNPQWHQQCRMGSQQRWLSTNHLMGPGYWVWVIPLYANITSIGIVMNDQVMNDSQINSAKDALKWLEKHQPRCAQAIDSTKIMDFVKVQDYAYDCSRVFSAEGWGLTGEAGVFADPFYSSGGDFLAISNQYLVELISQSKQGKDITLNTAIYQKLYQSIYQSTLSLYTDQYGGFGDRRMMAAKLAWDFAYYWGVLAFLEFNGALTNIGIMREAHGLLNDVRTTNNRMQTRFQQMANERIVRPAKGVFLDQYSVPCLHYFNDILKTAEDADCASQLAKNIALLQRLSVVLDDVLEDRPVTEQEKEILGEYGMLAR